MDKSRWLFGDAIAVCPSGCISLQFLAGKTFQEAQCHGWPNRFVLFMLRGICNTFPKVVLRLM